MTITPLIAVRQLLGVLLCVGALAGSAACSARPTGAPAAPTASASTAFASLANLDVLFAPVQRAGTDAALGWPASPPEAEIRRHADSVLAAVLGDRGLAGRWTFAEAVRRLARRNPTYTSDPDRLAITGLARVQPGDRVPEPLASELRGLIALTEARHVIVPLAVRYVPVSGAASGTGHAVLLLALVDARASQLLWIGPVSGDPSDSGSPLALSSVAENLADLILAR